MPDILPTDQCHYSVRRPAFGRLAWCRTMGAMLGALSAALLGAKPVSPLEITTGVYVQWNRGGISVSVDGRWVAFDTPQGKAFADLRSGQVDATRTWSLGAVTTAGTTFTLDHAWSPVGDLVAVKDKDLNDSSKVTVSIWKVGEKDVRQLLVIPKRLTSALYQTGVLAWAPDGKTLYLTLNQELPRWKWPVALDNPPSSSNNTELRISGMGEADTEQYGPLDSEYFSTKYGMYEGAYAEQNRTLVLALDVATGEVRLLFQGNDLKAIYPSPNGRWLALVQEKNEVKGREASWTQQSLADVYVLPVPLIADLPEVDLEKYDDRRVGNIDATGKRRDPVLRDVPMNIRGGSNLFNPHLLWAPDGSRFAYATTGSQATGDIFAFNPDTGETMNLTEQLKLPAWSKDNGYPGNHYPRQFNSPKFGDLYPPLWMPDGQGLLGIGHGDVWYVPVNRANPARSLTKNVAMETRHVVPTWSGASALVDAAGAITIVAKDKDTRLDTLYKVEVATGKATKFAETELWINVGLRGNESTDELIFTGQTMHRMTEVYRMPLGAPVAPIMVTDFKKSIGEDEWPEQRLLQWKTPWGAIARGWLFLPKGAGSDHKVPLLFEGTPGRFQSITDQFAATGAAWIQSQSGTGGLLTWLNKGVAVFWPDLPMSAPGVNEHPMQQIVGGVEAATDAALATGVIDGSRLAISSGDWGLGGYMVQAVATRSSRFKAGVSKTGWSNLFALYNVTIPETYRSGPPVHSESWRYYELGPGRLELPLWDDPTRYVENSPLCYLNQVRMPLLLLNPKWPGVRPSVDEQVNRGAQTFNVLQRLGRSVILSNGNGWDEITRIDAWLDQYLLGAKPTAQLAAQPSLFFGGGVAPAEASPKPGAPAPGR